MSTLSTKNYVYETICLHPHNIVAYKFYNDDLAVALCVQQELDSGLCTALCDMKTFFHTAAFQVTEYAGSRRRPLKIIKNLKNLSAQVGISQ